MEPHIKNKPSITSSVAPHLERRADFEAALRDYRLSKEAMQVLAATPFVGLTAPTSTGRNTIIRELVKTGNYYFIVSDTTRPKRYNDGVLEQEGVEYFFRSEDDILADIRTGKFIEAEIIHSQQVSGVSVREVEKARAQGKIAITDLEIEGGINLAYLKQDAITIFLLPPTFVEWLHRIQKRTSVTPLELHRRLQSTTKNLKLALETDLFIFVVNDNLNDAVQKVDEISRLGIRHPEVERQARHLAQKLYDETRAYLAVHAPDIKPW